MSTLGYILASTFLVSILSLVGVITFSKKTFFDKYLWVLVSFAAGAILAAVFFDLVPETYEMMGGLHWVLGGIIIFFVFEAIIHWHHHHETHCETCVQPVAFLNIAGDAIHNFLDGILIASSYFVNLGTGIATTIAVLSHEIPQELGDYAILVNAGMTKKQALFYNYLSAAFAMLGGILGYYFITTIEGILPYFIAVAAGGLLYIATADIIPQLHQEKKYARIITQVASFILGILTISFIIGLFPE